MKEQIKDIIKSKDLRNITFELVEKIIDSQITDELLKEVPIVKSIIAAKNIYGSFSDKIFIKKAMHVLLELSEVNQLEREKFIIELDEEHESGTEKILLAIDKLDNFKKCKVYGRLCKLNAKGKITVDEFLRLTKIIQDAYLDDLQLITYLDKNHRNEISEEEFYQLISLGLIYQERTEQKPIEPNIQKHSEYDSEFIGGEIDFFYSMSNIGRTLFNHYYDLFPENNI